MTAREWTIVVPVKRLGDAKSRLRSPGAPGDISALALAFAVDTVSAASGCGLVVVVTSDAVVADRMSALAVPVEIVPDPGAGLNAAVAAGAAVAPGPVAVLTGDLPALTTADLAAALEAAGRMPLGTVPDRDGSGTTLLTALDPRGLHPQFGPGSNALHRAGGHVQLEAGASLRADVDTEVDLRAAVALGVGTATAAALA